MLLTYASCCCPVRVLLLAQYRRTFLRAQPRRKGYALRASAKALVQQYYYMTQVSPCSSTNKHFFQLFV